jgi:1-acyl-sn-glycerol-3-phosphate acyltransferase
MSADPSDGTRTAPRSEPRAERAERTEGTEPPSERAEHWVETAEPRAERTERAERMEPRAERNEPRTDRTTLLPDHPIDANLIGSRTRIDDEGDLDDESRDDDEDREPRSDSGLAAEDDLPGAGARSASMSILPVARIRPDDHGPDTARRSDVDEWGRSEHMRSIVRRLYDPVYKYWFRVEWDGLEKIPLHGGALLICNHAGAIPSDAPAIMHGIEEELGRPVYGMADYFFRTIPVVGTMWSRTGGVPAHPDNAYRLLHDQQQLALVFPEGTKATSKTYSDRYRLRRFGRGGFVEIAMRAGVPIVPIACVGAEESMPILFRVNSLARALKLPYFPITVNSLLMGPIGYVTYFPVKMKFRVLDPIYFDVEPGQERYSRSRVMDEAENIRGTLQDSIHDMLRERRSVWFG